MKKQILKLALAITLFTTLNSCSNQDDVVFDRIQKVDRIINPNKGDEIITDVEVEPKVYARKVIIVICREFTSSGNWKGVGQDKEGFYYDLESKTETLIVDGKITHKQTITAKLSKLQAPWSPNC